MVCSLVGLVNFVLPQLAGSNRKWILPQANEWAKMNQVFFRCLEQQHTLPFCSAFVLPTTCYFLTMNLILDNRRQDLFNGDGGDGFYSFDPALRDAASTPSTKYFSHHSELSHSPLPHSHPSRPHVSSHLYTSIIGLLAQLAEQIDPTSTSEAFETTLNKRRATQHISTTSSNSRKSSTRSLLAEDQIYSYTT